jgi:HEAT repeat protein
MMASKGAKDDAKFRSDAFEKLLKAMIDCENSARVRKSAADAVGDIILSCDWDPELYYQRTGDYSKLVSLLLQALEDEDGGVRDAVARSIAKCKIGSIAKSKKDSRLAAGLIEALESEADSNVRAQLVRALGRQGDLAIKPLCEVLTNSREEFTVRNAAALVLGEMGDEADVGATLTRVATDEEEDLGLRTEARRALAKLSSAH